MTTSLEQTEFTVLAARGTTRVLLADYDPLSRHVLSSALHASASADGHVELVASVDALVPVDLWPHLDRIQVVVLVPCPQSDIPAIIHEITARGVHVLLLDARWDSQSLNGAIGAGASGCLIKDTAVDRIAVAAEAVAAGHMLLSPELLGDLRPALARPAQPGGNHDPDGLPLTEREREVLVLLAEGLSTAETATELGVSPSTVKSHVSHALLKLNARNRLEAVLRMRIAR